jgi:DNA-binding beta-propeller fold protein YncE
VTYAKHDLLTGLFPYNVVVAPNGSIALTADNGNAGSSDGNVDTVSVIDLSEPVHVIDHITVPDSPEGLAFSPKGNIAVAVDANGSNHPKSDWYYHPHGLVTVLKVDGKKVSRLNDVEVGALPEAVAFTPDGKYIYVGNYMDKDFSILQVDGTKVTNTGKHFKIGLAARPVDQMVSYPSRSCLRNWRIGETAFRGRPNRRRVRLLGRTENSA